MNKNRFHVKDLRQITLDNVKSYVSNIEQKVSTASLSVPSAHDYVSSINSVLKIMRGDAKFFISTRMNTNIKKRDYVAKHNKASSKKLSLDKIGTNQEVVVSLQKAFGLRFQESVKGNPVKWLIEAKSKNMIKVIDGTKGGRPRTIPITNDKQIKVLEKVALIQGRHWSLIPKDKTYAQFQRHLYLANTDEDFHSNRHQYAQERYAAIAGVPCPVSIGISHGAKHHHFIAKTLGISLKVAKALDKKARLIVSEELGHSRIEITNNYLG